MASPTQWTWVWVNSRSWWWTGRPGVLWFMGSQRVGHDWVTELNWTEPCSPVDVVLVSLHDHPFVLFALYVSSSRWVILCLWGPLSNVYSSMKLWVHSTSAPLWNSMGMVSVLLSVVSQHSASYLGCGGRSVNTCGMKERSHQFTRSLGTVLGGKTEDQSGEKTGLGLTFLLRRHSVLSSLWMM